MSEAPREAQLAVLVSGSGTNLQAILDARKAGELGANVRVVVSNRPGVKALERAQAAGVEALVVDHRQHADRAAFEAALDAALRDRGVTLVALAGFMRLLTPWFVGRWKGRLVNLHPSLLPAFPGAHAIRDALQAGASRTGVTVHFVDEGTDTGPVIAQVPVDILPGDSEDALAERIHRAEHQLYPRVIDQVARGLVRLDAGRVVSSSP